MLTQRPTGGPQIPPRRPSVPVPPAQQRPGRDPDHPYINHHANVGTLAKHMLLGLDPASATSTVETGPLLLIIHHCLTTGFHTAGTQRTPGTQKVDADLRGAQIEAAKANTDRAME